MYCSDCNKVLLNSILCSFLGTLQFLKELTNITKNSGEILKLRCDVKVLDANLTLSKIRTNWLHNEAPIDTSVKRIFIKTVPVSVLDL